MVLRSIPIPGGHGVVAALAERVAACDAQDGQPRASKRPVPTDCLMAVVRAAWLEPARRRKQRGDNPLVCPDPAAKTPRKRAFHRHCAARAMSVFNSSRRAAVPNTPAPVRAITTRSTATGIRARSMRNHSRTQRFTRFRTTAPPTRRLTTSPSRVALAFGVTSRVNVRVDTRRPCARDRRKSRFCVTRLAAGNRCGLPERSCGSGVNRATTRERAAYETTWN